MSTEPQYAPGDHVLVAGAVHEPLDEEGDYFVVISDERGIRGCSYVRAADVHPVPPTPDRHDAAIAAVRGLLDALDGGTSSYPSATVATSVVRRLLDEVAPVHASPAPDEFKAWVDADSTAGTHEAAAPTPGVRP